jgi:hypothetical protein
MPPFLEGFDKGGLKETEYIIDLTCAPVGFDEEGLGWYPLYVIGFPLARTFLPELDQLFHGNITQDHVDIIVEAEATLDTLARETQHELKTTYGTEALFVIGPLAGTGGEKDVAMFVAYGPSLSVDSDEIR